MEIKSLSDFSKLIDVCLKKGVETVKVSQGSIEFKLKDSAEPKKRKRRGEATETQAETETTQLTEEEQLFWSTGQVGH